MSVHPKCSDQIEALKAVKNAYIRYVLCGTEDPYNILMKQRLHAIAGNKGSNLLAMVRIKNAGKEALKYRTTANKVLYEDLHLQSDIKKAFESVYKDIVLYRNKNPLCIRLDGVSEKAVWHHSSNHILSVSLIPERIHIEFRKYLHCGRNRGGNIMFSC